MSLIAYHNDPAIKEKYLTRVAAHRAADQLIKGDYWKNGKGCAVGYTIHGSNHAAYETELGIPRILARLEDGIFEGLPNDRAMLWPEQFLSAIRPGADLSMVWPRFAVWLLGDPADGVIRFAKSKRSRKAIQDIVDAYAAVVEGTAQKIDWWKLRDAAYAAAAYAAADAAYAADASAYAAYASAYAYAYAAYDAADAAYDAAAAAAASAAAASAAAAARQASRVKQADKLLELLAAC